MLGVVSVVRADDGPADGASIDAVGLTEQRVRSLLEAGDVHTARRVTEEALQTSQDSPELLWLLADVEFADGDQPTGMSCVAKAADASGRDPAAVSRQIRELAKNDLWRETLMTVGQVPAKVRGDPLVRTAIGDFYETLRCHGHAVGGYGERSGLPSSARRKRRRSWLRSGGPFTFVRRRVDAWEDSRLLSDLRKGQRPSAQLDAVPDLDSRQAHRLKVRSEDAHYTWVYHYELWESVRQSGPIWHANGQCPFGS
jgi:hypothetical protein